MNHFLKLLTLLTLHLCIRRYTHTVIKETIGKVFSKDSTNSSKYCKVGTKNNFRLNTTEYIILTKTLKSAKLFLIA